MGSAMDVKKTNLSAYDETTVPQVGDLRIGIVVSEWNREITGKLLEGAINTLTKFGAKEGNLDIHWVPGSFELTAGAAMLIESTKPDAIICLGCVIQGETRHFEFICQAVGQGLTQLSIKTLVPVIFGVLTTDTFAQALDRAGGAHGNKGEEAAITALKMGWLKRGLSLQKK